MKIKPLLIGASLIGAGYYVGWAVATAPVGDLKAKLSVSVPYRIPVELKEAARKIGLTDQQLIDTKAQMGADPDVAACGVTYALSCYDPNGDTIRIFGSSFDKTKNAGGPEGSLAYEYSHHYWKISGNAEQERLKPYIEAFYQKNKAALEHDQADILRLEGGHGTAAFYSEMHSIACTETADNHIDPELLKHCNSFIPNRSVLKRIY